MKKIVNTTPHPIRFQSQDGEVYEVPPCGTVINAYPVVAPVGTHASGAQLVSVRYEATVESLIAVRTLKYQNPGAIIVGSNYAAHAFPGEVYSFFPAQGFEEVPPEQKNE